jgi:hypothetical protein
MSKAAEQSLKLARGLIRSVMRPVLTQTILMAAQL